MNFEAVIGLEIHVEMKTRSKMFSSAPVTYGREPNTALSPFDLAFPGTMPTVNEEAVRNGIRLAHALGMEIDPLVRFDRKNYFYSDLPKGFQITQQFHPIGRNGSLLIRTSRGERRIGIERIHLEEDTAKQLHFPDCSLLDYNRAGVPLVEIVSLPEIRTGEEARLYVEGIRNIVLYAGISDGKMEEGSLRVDVNVSIRPYGTKEFGTKVEIKNLNSIKNIELALDYEIERQAALLLMGKEVRQETRRYDEGRGETVLMRLKTDAVDYKYFPEPNIAPIALSEEFVKKAIETCPELYESKRSRYIALGLTEKDAEVILQDKGMALYFDKALAFTKYPKSLANFLLVEGNQYLNKKGLSWAEFPLSPEWMGEAVLLQEEGGFQHKQAAEALALSLEEGISPKEAAGKLGLKPQVSDEGFLAAIVDEVLSKNPQSIQDFRNGKDRALGFLVGQGMKLSRGKANPARLSEMIRERILKEE